MPEPKGDRVRFVLHQTEKDPKEVIAQIIKEEEYEKLCEKMAEAGSTLCEPIKSGPFKAKVDEAFIIRIVGDVIVKTFGEHSYRSDRIQLKYLRNRVNRRDFYVKGYYRGRYQPEYVGKVLLHRSTIHAGTTNKGSGRQFGMTNLESVLGKIVSTTSIVLPKMLDDPLPEETVETLTAGGTKKDIVLRTISKDIQRGFAVPLAMHLFGLTETEILNLNLLPNHHDYNEQRYLVLQKWRTQEGEDASFEKLITAFRAVKMTAPAQSLNRNLLTTYRLKIIANALPSDLQGLSDHFKIKMVDVEAKYTSELNEHIYQILSRWKESTHERLSARACHLKLLQHLRNISLEHAAKKCNEITSVDARDVVILRIVTKDASRETIFRLVESLGVCQDDVDAITRTFGFDFNKRMFLLNCLVKWRENEENATFENLLAIMRSKTIGLKLNAHILDEELLSSKRLIKLAEVIDPEYIQSLADELEVDTSPMNIPFDGNFQEALRFRLLQRWKETRGKYATHTELINALRKVGLSSVVPKIDLIGSIDTTHGALCDFCLRYVSSWMHVSRAHEWPSVVQNIPSSLVEGLDSKTIDQIKRKMRDPQEQMAHALALCRDRAILPTVAKFVDRLTACGFEQAAKTFLDIARPVLYYSGLKPYDI